MEQGAFVVMKRRSAKYLMGVALVGLAFCTAMPAIAAQAPTPAEQLLIDRLQQMEQRLNQLEGRPAPVPAPPVQALDTQAILDRLTAIDDRITDLESRVVLSEPSVTVRQVEAYVDQNGNQYDEPGPGRREITTYQRETAFRRQSVADSIEEALASEAEGGITVGVSSVTTGQAAFQSSGPKAEGDGHVFGVSQADIYFLAESAALNTSFYADVVAIGGPPPDGEIPALNLLNSQTARLSNNALNLREAWIRTELFNQSVALTVGQLDLTNYFDNNAVANDETSQFISDALVNDPALGLSANGLGAAAIFNTGGPFTFKVGVQQSDPTATSLSTSLFTLGEVEYLVTPFGLPEGHYRVWGRLDNSTGSDRTGWGVSADQKITPSITVFGRYGNGYIGGLEGRLAFWSTGLGFSGDMAINPLDSWGVGFARTDIETGPFAGPNEKLVEGFYNLRLTEHFALSFMLQYVYESFITDDADYILPGVRMAVEF